MKSEHDARPIAVVIGDIREALAPWREELLTLQRESEPGALGGEDGLAAELERNARVSEASGERGTRLLKRLATGTRARGAMVDAGAKKRLERLALELSDLVKRAPSSADPLDRVYALRLIGGIEAAHREAARVSAFDKLTARHLAAGRVSPIQRDPSVQVEPFARTTAAVNVDVVKRVAERSLRSKKRVADDWWFDFAIRATEAIDSLDRACDRRGESQVAAEVSATTSTSAAPESPRAVPDVAHSDDFASAKWFGRNYTFNSTQARCVAMLWKAWESGGLALNQRTIGEAIESANDSFRLDHTFRGHPALETMIRRIGEGVYALQHPIETPQRE